MCTLGQRGVAAPVLIMPALTDVLSSHTCATGRQHFYCFAVSQSLCLRARVAFRQSEELVQASTYSADKSCWSW